MKEMSLICYEIHTDIKLDDQSAFTLAVYLPIFLVHPSSNVNCQFSKFFFDIITNQQMQTEMK